VQWQRSGLKGSSGGEPGRHGTRCNAAAARDYPSIATIAALLGSGTEAAPAAIPLDCTDGFQEAYYGRPEALLGPEARRACSGHDAGP